MNARERAIVGTRFTPPSIPSPALLLRESSCSGGCKKDETGMSLAMHYRRRAEEIRLCAKSQQGPAREKLLQLADSYESAAKFYEQTNFPPVTKLPAC